METARVKMVELDEALSLDHPSGRLHPPAAIEERSTGPHEPPPERRHPAPTGDFNLRILLHAPARHIAAHYGRNTLEQITHHAGLAPRQFDGRYHWGSLEQVERFLEAVRDIVANDEEFKTAMAYRLHESIGPMRFAIRAITPLKLYKMMVDTFHLVSTISKLQIHSSTHNSMVLRYRSEKRESRLICLSRQAQGAALPTLWGLPPARLVEKNCITRGDDYCEYQLQWFEYRRSLPLLLGLLLGGLSALGITFTGLGFAPWVIWLPVVGALTGHGLELYRINRINLGICDESNAALRKLAEEDAEARQEILGLHRRQREWTRMLEKKTTNRTVQLEKVVEQAKALQLKRSAILRGFSHDLRNPLGTLRMNAVYLREQASELGTEQLAAIDDLEDAVVRMERLLVELMKISETERTYVRIEPETLEVEYLVEQYHRRVRALAYGRDIRVSVFATREAPGTLTTDVSILDRVVDNLLTNAVKFTSKGSIVVELDGRPGFLTIKVSDTGRGIEPAKLKQIFLPHGVPNPHSTPHSFGVGLSVVVQLMAQIGGQLEVMSKPGVGSTFWAHFPLELATEDPSGSQDTADPPILAHLKDRLMPHDLIDRIVHIRRKNDN